MLICVGTNHKFAPIVVRERVSFLKKDIEYILNFLQENAGLQEVVAISTCNRIEVYVTSYYDCAKDIIKLIMLYHNIKEDLSDYFYIYQGIDALRHLCEVTSGLDSQILGETQIKGQVKFYFEEAYKRGFIKDFLKDIFYTAFQITQKVHMNTKITEGKLSLGSITLELIKDKMDRIESKNIVIIGTGKASELVARYLYKEEFKLVFVANKNFFRAEKMAKEFKGKVIGFEKLKEFLEYTNVVITATSSPHLILKKDGVLAIIDSRIAKGNYQPLLIIDLALPRDVDPSLKDCPYILLYSLEDMDYIIRKNMENKLSEKYKAQIIINREVEKAWEERIGLVQEKACLL